MCDYSLEMYRTRPAVTGERYETRRFESGSIGFVAPGSPEIAVCMACDTRLELDGIRDELRQRLGVPASAAATFVRLESGPHRDGVRFDNGAEVTLQQLGVGVGASVVDALTHAPMPATRRSAELEPVR